MCQYHNLLKLNSADKPVEGWKVFMVGKTNNITFLSSVFQGYFWTPGEIRYSCVEPFHPRESFAEEIGAGYFHAFYRKEDAIKYMESIKEVNDHIDLTVKKVKIPVDCPYYKGITYTMSGGSKLVEGLDSFASQYLMIE